MTSILPSSYLSWFRHSVLAQLEPLEPEALALNCAQCFMVAPKGRTRDLGPFRQDLKCCTFTPFLPSYALGELLARPELADVWQGYFGSQMVCLTPLGAVPQIAGTSVCETGRHLADRCPFLEKSENPGCRIFDARPSSCASYVCTGGGDAFYRKWRSWGDALAQVEWELAHEVAFAAGYTLDDVRSEFQTIPEAVAFYQRALSLALELRALSR